MANRCASLDPTWAHLPTPAPAHAAAARHYYFSPTAAFENEALTSALLASMAPAAHAYSGSPFENEALTSALRASMAPVPHAYSASAAASSFSCPTTPSSSTTSSASELLSACSGGGHGDSPAAPAASSKPARARALSERRPTAGRVTKRKPRQQSRRPQTTYITADPANFRRMVQEITGLAVVDGAAKSESEAVRNWTTTPPAPACVLPTLDTSAFLLDRAAAAAAAVPAAPEGKKSAVSAAAGDVDGSSALLEALAAEWGFPTLESWGMI